MKHWLMIGLLFMVPAMSQAQESKAVKTPTSLPGINIVEVDTVKKWLDMEEDIFILDTRKQTDFEESHIPSAELCAVNTDRGLSEEVIEKAVVFLERCEPLKSLAKTDKIVAYCNADT